ncbi:MAG: hypothetical protein II714_05075 [Oscillospiraceae bacterium]|nr:hypothetical protein [Oscillospiraceae bacterium]
MTLLITVIAAVAATVVWYLNSDKGYALEKLCLMYWGASLMWLCDAVAEYIELGSEYFSPSSEDMLNDAFLGICAVTLGMVIWLIILIIKDPKRVFARAKTSPALTEEK